MFIGGIEKLAFIGAISSMARKAVGSSVASQAAKGAIKGAVGGAVVGAATNKDDKGNWAPLSGAAKGAIGGGAIGGAMGGMNAGLNRMSAMQKRPGLLKAVQKGNAAGASVPPAQAA